MKAMFRILLTLLLIPSAIHAQKRVVGKVLDLRTNEPVPNATVYINQTQLTTSTDEKGVFVLKTAPAGSSVIVTHVAYEKTTVPVTLSDTLRILLPPKDASLDNVVISMKNKDNWKKWGSLFTDYFIGTGMTKKCVLLNPEDIHFYYSKKNMTVKAWAKKPLLIENRMLGYVLHIDLDSFVYSFHSGSFLYAVSSFFEPMTSADPDKEKVWAANRLLSYRGSKKHFMRALYNRRIRPEGFALYKYRGIYNQEKARVETLLLKLAAEQYNTGGASANFAYRKDSAFYFNKVLSQPSYFFQDSTIIDIPMRWHKGADGTVSFDFGKDSMLLRYHEPAHSPAMRRISRWSTMKEELAMASQTYNFLQGPDIKGKHTLFYLTQDTNILITKNGFIENNGSVFAEGFLADRRLAYDLPWDYDPDTDDNKLGGEESASHLLAKQIESSLEKIAANHSPSELYLHLDKTIYDPGENIWFAAYLLKSRLPADEHHTLYAALINKQTKTKLASESFVMASGLCSGYMFLSDTIPPGDYMLVAYTNTYVNEMNPAVFQQEITLRPQVQPFSVRYSEDMNTYRNDSVFILCKVKNEQGIYAEGNEVTYRLMGSGEVIASGKTKINGYGELILGGIPVPKILGKKLSLVSTIGPKNEKTEVHTALPLTKNYLSVKCYPESGNLIDGISSRLVFELKDLNGNPVATEATLLENGQAVAPLQSGRTGTGFLQFVPKKDAVYSLKFPEEKWSAIPGKFPEVLPMGFVIQTNDAVVSDSLRFAVRTNHAGTEGFVLVHDYRETYFAQPIRFSANEINIQLAAGELPEGLSTITVFDAQGRPAAERTVFKRPTKELRLMIEMDSAYYHNRSRVRLHLKATDADNNPVKALLSLACVTNKRLDTARFQDIVSYNQFNNYRTAGAMQNNAGTSLPAEKKDLENFLLVQCWTRYLWNDLERDEVATKPFSLIQKGVVLYEGSKLKKPVELIVLTSGAAHTVMTDERGRFELNRDMLATEADWSISIVVNGENQKDYSITLQNDNDSLQARLAAMDFPESMRFAAPEEEPLLPFVKLMDKVTIKTKLESNDPSRRICPDYVCMYNVLNCQNHPFKGKAPQVGQAYKTLIGDKMRDKVYTECTNSRYKLETAKSFVAQLKGRYYTKEFYEADYEKFNPPFPETLTTLYWNPMFQTDEHGEAEISFYTNDLKGVFSIVAQGIAVEGVISGKKVFSVLK